MALTAKQHQFVREFLLDLNATQAAIRAGYSANSAQEQGSQMLSHPEIKAVVEAAMAKRSAKTEIDAERVLEEIAAMAFYDPAELIGVSRELADGEECSEGEGVISFNGKRYAVSGISSPAHIAGLPENVRRAIVGWSWDRNENFTLKLADKSKALDQLARHLSLYNDRIEVSAFAGLADRLERARDRGNADDRLAPATSPSLPAPPLAAVATASAVFPAGRTEPAAPAAPPSPPKPYRPIMPAPVPVTWPSFCGNASTDYDPT
ncbi:terminase small subunit [Bradyrhizobium sp. OAE829]|uniref:terminase small subunit n=1 Tax=Bradyrhizobium sp. OAE829 TaxID=2663807 RepID=UPI00178BE2AC